MLAPTVAVPESIDNYLRWVPETQYPEKATLYSGASPKIFRVSSGIVRVYRALTNGESLTLGLYGPGALLGDNVAINEVAVAHTDCSVAEWSADRLLLQASVGGMRDSYCEILKARYLRAAEILEESTYSIRERLALALLRIGKEVGAEDIGGWVRLPVLTHECLSSMISATREAVTVHLGELRKIGITAANSSTRTGILIDPAAISKMLSEAGHVR